MLILIDAPQALRAHGVHSLHVRRYEQAVNKRQQLVVDGHAFNLSKNMSVGHACRLDLFEWDKNNCVCPAYQVVRCFVIDQVRRQSMRLWNGTGGQHDSWRRAEGQGSATLLYPCSQGLLGPCSTPMSTPKEQVRMADRTEAHHTVRRSIRA